jgi:hypothetical protein
MEKVYAFKRLTHGYADGWRYLDKDVYLGSVNMTPARQTEAPKDYDDGGAFVQYARAPSGVNMQQLIQALRDTLGGSNCRHEHDCCGCASRHVSVSHLGSRRLLIRTRVSFNY